MRESIIRTPPPPKVSKTYLKAAAKTLKFLKFFCISKFRV